VLGRLNRRSQSRYRSVALVAVAALASTALTACGGSGAGGATTVNWYINPDSSGATQKVQAACNQQAAGRYQIAISVLPATADGQREQLVRRLAAKDPSIDLMSVDPPYMPELANAGWLQAFDETQKTEVLKDILKSPIESATWKGQLVGAPYSANTQLLWYRKSVAQKAGIDPTRPDFTWAEMLEAALKTNTTIAEQGLRYEGYMVWVNALVEGAGGHILTDNEKGRDATVSVDSDAGRVAAGIIRSVAGSKAADPALSTSKEEQGRATFNGPTGGFLLNWPYSYAATQGNVKDGSVPQSVLDDYAWARYPRAVKDKPSRPPLGGVNLAISKFSTKKDNAYDALKCIISPAQSKTKMLILGDPSANSTVYDDPEIRKAFPMADLMRESINDAGPRPVTPFYGDVSAAIQRDWHPPASVNDDSVKSSAQLIGDVLHDRRLL
jgi:multiple sugar transport system substrate-binding protein